jgi:hypothetical protein
MRPACAVVPALHHLLGVMPLVPAFGIFVVC